MNQEAMELLERFAAGDLDAFETLFRQFQGPVYRWVIRVVRDPAAAEDLTVETFWRIYRARARFDPRNSFGSWARRIATNAAIDHLNKARREEGLSEQLAAPQGNDPAIQREVTEKVQRAFQQLPASLRATATMALVEDLPYEEIAEALGTPVGTVKSRVFRAVRLLRRKLERAGIRP